MKKYIITTLVLVFLVFFIPWLGGESNATPDIPDETPPQERTARTQLDRNPQKNPAISYKQREYSAGDDDKLFVDLDEYLKEEG